MFERFARWCTRMLGNPYTFAAWCVILVGWATLGPTMRYGTTWQFLINTPTTVFEMFAAILIQYMAGVIERRQERLDLESRQRERLDRERSRRLEQQNEEILLWLREIRQGLEEAG